MPELPEVETVVRDLRPLLVGRRLTAVRSSAKRLRTRWSKSWEKPVVGSQVAAIRRRGKWILVDLAPRGLLVLHLGMTGQLTVQPASSPRPEHTHLIFSLDDGGSELRFRDIRRFGSATWFADENGWNRSRAVELGPEPFDLEGRSWHASLAKADRCMKALLLDQGVVAGVGNIYADESLFQSRIHPRQRGRELTLRQTQRLREALLAILTRAIAGRGSTIRDYVGGSGLMGEYQDTLAVYGRTGEPCLRCRAAIECIRLAGRSTHFCPNCQILPMPDKQASKTLRH